MASNGIDVAYYKEMAKSIGSRKSLGQNFLINSSIAAFEAEYARGMNAIELGPGLGILTRELLRTAKRVIAIEKDARLYEMLNEQINSRKLTLINADFFSIDTKRYDIDIMVSNIPYNLSSSMIYWLSRTGIPALICVQKEFGEHMLAVPGTRNYSKLSVISSLSFRMHKIKEISARNFYPVPRVDSWLVHLAPKSNSPDSKTVSTITAIMNHKKKRLRNAVIDASSALGMTKAKARTVLSGTDCIEERPLHMQPEKLLEIAVLLNSIVEDQNE